MPGWFSVLVYVADVSECAGAVVVEGSCYRGAVLTQNRLHIPLVLLGLHLAAVQTDLLVLDQTLLEPALKVENPRPVLLACGALLPILKRRTQHLELLRPRQSGATE